MFLKDIFVVLHIIDCFRYKYFNISKIPYLEHLF